METFLQAEEAGLGDIDTLEAQLAESNVSFVSPSDFRPLMEH